MIHCVQGRERSCLTMAVVLLALGVTSEAVASDFETNQATAVDPHWLDDVFARVAAGGGIDRYLASHSVVRADIDSLRSQALE